MSNVAFNADNDRKAIFGERELETVIVRYAQLRRKMGINRKNKSYREP